MIPKGNLYDDLYFRYSVKEDSTALADTHILHNRPVPLHSSARLSLRLRVDTLENKQQYGIIRTQKGRRSWIGGTYRNGWFEMNSKSVITYKFDKERLKKGKHTLKLTVTDAAGNRSEYKYSFVW